MRACSRHIQPTLQNCDSSIYPPESGNGYHPFRVSLEEAPMSSEKPTDDLCQQTDWKNTKQTDKPWNGPVEKEQKSGGPPPDLEKWHETNTH